MRIYLFIIAALMLAGFSGFADAQSRRGEPSSPDKKSNARPSSTAIPEPSPTPFQHEAEAEDGGEVISVDTRLVTIPVRVLDRKNRFIGGLKKENFSVFEDNVPQEIGHFSNEAEPFTVALVLDMSYSTTFKLEEIQNAALAFIAQLRPNDRVAVLSFDEEVHVLCEPTTDRKEIQAAIRRTRISTGTSLYDAIDMVMNSTLRSVEGRKAIVLFTDGVDTTSRKTFGRDILSDAMEVDALIYPVRYDTFNDVQAMKDNPTAAGVPGIGATPGIHLPEGISMPQQRPPRIPISAPRKREPTDSPGPSTVPPAQRGTTRAEYEYAEEFLDKLAQRTGGRMNLASNYGNLNAAFARIASELREFYTLGYYPGEPDNSGRERKIKVKVDQEDRVVRARAGYVIAQKRDSAPDND